MESIVYGFTDKSIQKHYSTALNKIKSVLRNAQKDNVEFLEQQTKFQIPERLINDYEYLSPLQSAISEKSIVAFDYKNNKEEISRREAEPIGLIFYAFSWHLIAWCHLRNDYRDFKVMRILKIRNTGDAFKKNDHISLNDYMKLLPVNY
jgi:predicted DNA-binding transcriptional regulator YafY